MPKIEAPVRIQSLFVVCQFTDTIQSLWAEALRQIATPHNPELGVE